MTSRRPRPSPDRPPTTTRRAALLAALAGAGGLGHASAQAQTGADMPIASGNGPPITFNGMQVSTPQPLQRPLVAASYQFHNQTDERYWVFSFTPGVVLDLAVPAKVIIWYLRPDGIWVKKRPPVVDVTAYLVKPDQLIQLTWPIETEVLFRTRPLTPGE